MKTEQRLKINEPDVIYECFDDEVVVINLESGNYYSLNKAGRDIWSLIVAGQDSPQIIRELVMRYRGVPTEIELAVRSLVLQLQAENLIIVDGYGQTTGPCTIGPDGAAVPSDVPDFETPVLNRYTDMQDLLLLDPIHEVHETGWPNRKPESGDGAA